MSETVPVHFSKKTFKIQAENSKKFKPNSQIKKLRLNIVQPSGGLTITDIKDIDDVLKVDAWEGNVKIGRFRLSDIKVKYK